METLSINDAFLKIVNFLTVKSDEYITNSLRDLKNLGGCYSIFLETLKLKFDNYQRKINCTDYCISCEKIEINSVLSDDNILTNYSSIMLKIN